MTKASLWNPETVLSNKKQVPLPSVNSTDSSSQQFQTVLKKRMELSVFYKTKCIYHNKYKQNIAACTDIM